MRRLARLVPVLGLACLVSACPGFQGPQTADEAFVVARRAWIAAEAEAVGCLAQESSVCDSPARADRVLRLMEEGQRVIRDGRDIAELVRLTGELQAEVRP